MNARRIPLLLALIFPFTLSLAAEPVPDWNRWGGGEKPIPAGAKVRLETDQPSYLLGENVLLHFILENTGSEPFSFSVGGDYRGSTRALRYQVTATDAAGVVAPDPDTEHMNMGGLVGPHSLKPGEQYIESLALNRYCRIEAPGTYTIRATHDLGWKETADQKRPVGQLTLTFRMPTAPEAEAVVTAMEKLPETERQFGKKSAPYADFSGLRFPVYLPILLHRAQAGSEPALNGIASIPTKEATATLLQLANEADGKVAIGAARALNSRLPDPEFAGKLPGRGPFRFDRLQDRKEMAEKSWNASFAPEVRKLALRLLTRDDTESIGTGAFMIQAIGTAEDGVALEATLQRVIDQYREPRHKPEDNILNLPEPLPELARAVLALGQRGYRNDGTGGMGKLFAHFTLLQDTPAPRPKHWQQSFDAFALYGPVPVREAGLRSIPEPMPEACVPTVLKCMLDKDFGVARAACEVAAKSKRADFLQPAVEFVATADHEWLLNAASNLAYACGARLELYQAWADRLGSEKLYGHALQTLTLVLEVPRSSSGRTDLPPTERLALKKAWQDFLTKNAIAIAAGKQFPLTDPAVSPALAGRAIAWHLPDGTTWPSDAQVGRR